MSFLPWTINYPLSRHVSIFLCKFLNVITGNSPRLFYPLFPLLQKRCLLRFGYGVWVFELSWTLFWISCKDSHVNEINFSRLVFINKVINGNVAVVNDPVLHMCVTTDSCRHDKIRLHSLSILEDPQVTQAHEWESLLACNHG